MESTMVHCITESALMCNGEWFNGKYSGSL